MKRKKILFSLLFFGLGWTISHAQETINASGGGASGSGGSASYSIGQVFYTNATGIDGSVSPGAQQPYEISIVLGMEEAKGINLAVSVYPNPTIDYLTLEVNASAKLSIQSMAYQLYDLNGKLLQSEMIASNPTSIAMSNLMPATYFIKVVKMQGIGSHQEVKTFKIIKNSNH